MRSFNRIICIASLLLVVATGCKKLIEIPASVSNIDDKNVFSTDASAVGVLNGLYVNMSTTQLGFSGLGSVTVFTGLSADELNILNGFNGTANAYYSNSLSTLTGGGSELWSPFYQYIFSCNSAIEGLEKSDGLTPAIKQQLLGEAKFIRAYVYFYLVNLFGDVPLALTSDYKVNALMARTPVDKVYAQIVIDLKEAQQLLSEGYYNGTITSFISDRVRPSKWAALALLARTYLFMNEFAKAGDVSSTLISNSTLFELPALNNAFLKTSKEAIWQIQPTTLYFNTEDAKL